MIVARELPAQVDGHRVSFGRTSPKTIKNLTCASLQ